MNVNSSPVNPIANGVAGGIDQPKPKIVADPVATTSGVAGGVDQPKPLSVGTGDTVVTLSSEAIEASNNAV